MIMTMSALLEKSDSSGTREFTGESTFGCEALCFSQKVRRTVARARFAIEIVNKTDGP